MAWLRRCFDGGNQEVLEARWTQRPRSPVIVAWQLLRRKRWSISLRTLESGGRGVERRIFHSLFGSQDQKIGMKGFCGEEEGGVESFVIKERI